MNDVYFIIISEWIDDGSVSIVITNKQGLIDETSEYFTDKTLDEVDNYVTSELLPKLFYLYKITDKYKYSGKEVNNIYYTVHS